jgi:hypothetical protein
MFLIFFTQFVSPVSLFFPGYLLSDGWLKPGHVLVGGGLKVTLDLKPPLREVQAKSLFKIVDYNSWFP